MNPNNNHSTYTSNNKYDGDNSSDINFDNDKVRIEITQFINQVNYWLMIIECIMVLCGTFGNTLALVVINRRSLRHTSSSVFITYLAIFDTSVLIVHWTNLVITPTMKSYIVHCFLVYLTDVVTFCSVWIMVIMTIERCIAVHSPFLAKRLCTPQRARYSMYILIFVVLMVFSLTYPYIYVIDKHQNKCGIRPQYQTIIRILKPAIFYLAPDIILLINLLIIYELFMARRQRANTLINPENAVNQINAASFNRQQQQLTIMLVTVSLSFYLFTTPAIIDYILQRNPPNYRDIKRLKMRFLRSNLTVFWLQMSSATNFFFYCLAGSRFRANCLETLNDIYDYIRIIFDDNYQRRRSSTPRHTSINIGLEMRHERHCDYRDRLRSSSLPQATYSYQLSTSIKRPSVDTILNNHINSRRTPKYAFNMREL